MDTDTNNKIDPRNKYNAKAYDRVIVFVRKGEKGKIKARADEHNSSINGYIKSLIRQDIKDFEA